ncbi:MAG: molybdenum-binding protein [candidate division Zixibacteria bacterium]|jgi:molybdopterin-binding protein|nr:molybdenum-binding protein [candidate division Zixibacteria bacterium]
MKYGARNQLIGEVKKIKRGGVMSQITIEIPEKSVMNSVITIESLDDLGITDGDKVKLIIKAVNVLLVKE